MHNYILSANNLHVLNNALGKSLINIMSNTRPKILPLCFPVLNDIVATMFNKRFMDELFKPQLLYSKKAMRTVFDRLAHASIMRLNAASMDKVSLPYFLLKQK